ncbi:putative secretion ATPase (PEP-CTERM system associated) [Novosphingobium capsulatum]|uniref:Secretion ATPase (PEP-CTERM system associated) n=1 Tax=Novosphingobium capsulatum TaxID=13688 RepID=A0ABU1MGC9_9SPHN|nr:XrtA/PEP-CTERM system-associated ATPase [Novosphingobium capsulatum]MDR6509386.1 putative secretion ATPase (PEP-CTERM system associated) [Novosphingobium capsulatum]
MYDDFYRLSARPFQLTPDPDFYFESATHKKALSYLGYGLAQGEGFIVITGEVGAGKSTLAAHLLASIDRAQLTAAQIVTSKLDGQELVHMAARAFGLDVAGHDKAAALARIEAFLHDEARAGRRCLLVVDEAQNLSVEALEELRMLSNFQLGAHPLLQILLLGQPEFRTLLQQSPRLEQLRQRVIATHHLAPMEPEEVGPYVEHRLVRAGWNGNPAFEPRFFADLARASGGVPRRVNQILSRVLLAGALEQASRIEAGLLHAVLDDMASDSAVSVESAPAPAAAPAAASSAMPEAASSQALGLTADTFHGEGQGQAKPEGDGSRTTRQDFDLAAIEAAMASRDEQIAELQQAVIEVAEMRAAHGDEAAAAEADGTARTEALEAALSDAAARIGVLEHRLAEQEQAIRHVLTMLIEWFETDRPKRAA